MLRDGWSMPIEGVPVWQRTGSSLGPTVLLTAGIHGDEYEGPAAISAAIRDLAVVPLHGRIIAIPVANPMAWKAATRLSPDDGLNLARVFPGNAAGSPTERLASALFEIAREADFLIDLHSGGSDYLFSPLAGYYGDASLEAARRFGLPVLWKLPETPGVLSCELSRIGATAIGCEYLGAGQLSHQGVESYRRGIRSCLALWGMLTDEEPIPASGRTYQGDWTLAEATGAFFAEVTHGDFVKRGTLLATVRDVRGQVLQTFQALQPGLILAIRSKGYIRAGDWGVIVATPA